MRKKKKIHQTLNNLWKIPGFTEKSLITQSQTSSRILKVRMQRQLSLFGEKKHTLFLVMSKKLHVLKLELRFMLTQPPSKATKVCISLITFLKDFLLLSVINCYDSRNYNSMSSFFSPLVRQLRVTPLKVISAIMSMTALTVILADWYFTANLFTMETKMSSQNEKTFQRFLFL